jgi:acetyl-CoA acetyltransferase
MFPNARIPYGTWGSSFFPAWQTSALAEVNIGQFAGEAMNRILGKRRVSTDRLDYLVIGSTVPWHWKAEVVGVLTFDRTSDSPVGVFPERRAYQRTVPLADVWDNFAFDPATSGAMIASAGKAARKHGVDRREVDEVALLRHEQYFAARESGALDNVLVPLDVLNIQGRPLGRIDDDLGVRRITAGELRAMRELDTCVTGGTQTHASDGMATLLVTTPEKAKEISARPEVDIQFVAKSEVRSAPSLMPEAPVIAVRRLLDRTGLSMDDIAVSHSHNPFAVNDVIAGKVLECDWRDMNKTGCSLVWGHPQGPTLTRTLIEALEEAVALGGGYVLIFGCAAGDVGTSALFKVS